MPQNRESGKFARCLESEAGYAEVLLSYFIDCETCILYMPDVADICMQVMVLFNYRCLIFAVITFFFFACTDLVLAISNVISVESCVHLVLHEFFNCLLIYRHKDYPII